LPCDRVTNVTSSRQVLPVNRFAEPADFVDFFKTNYGPTITVYRAIAEDPDRVAALDRDLTDLARRFHHDGVMPREYLLVTARRR